MCVYVYVCVHVCVCVYKILIMVTLCNAYYYGMYVQSYRGECSNAVNQNQLAEQ